MTEEALIGGRFAHPTRDGDTVVRRAGPAAANIHGFSASTVHSALLGKSVPTRKLLVKLAEVKTLDRTEAKEIIKSYNEFLRRPVCGGSTSQRLGPRCWPLRRQVR